MYGYTFFMCSTSCMYSHITRTYSPVWILRVRLSSSVLRPGQLNRKKTFSLSPFRTENWSCKTNSAFLCMYCMYVCCCCFVVYLILTDPLRIQPWSQNRRNQIKSNRKSEISREESRQNRMDNKVASKGHRRDKQKIKTK